ncbi:MAG: hypothetical protein ACOZF0_21360 [Thermodesulfobacteriota bacterium]
MTRKHHTQKNLPAMLLFPMLILCLPLSAAAGEGPAESPAIAGSYIVNGTAPGGAGVYSGIVVIRQEGDVYRLAWNVAGEGYVGTGIVTDNTLSVVYSDTSGRLFGIAAYAIGRDGHRLTGKWTAYQGARLGTEILTRAEGEHLKSEEKTAPPVYEM